jgi:hypothetical protein
MDKKKKDFEAFPVRTLRASDEVWEAFKKKRSMSGKTWNGFLPLLELVNK